MGNEVDQPQVGGDHVPPGPGGADQTPPAQPVVAPADAGDAGDADAGDIDWGYSTIREAPALDDSVRGEPAPKSDHDA